MTMTHPADRREPIAGDEPTSPSPTPATIPPTMDAVVARRYGDSGVLHLESVETPSPAAGELLVRVEASSVNPLDWHFLTGTPYVLRLLAGVRQPKRTIHGADVAGTVVAVGPEIADIVIGDRVVGESGGGGFAPYAAVRRDCVVPVPPGVDSIAAAATPVAGLTALQALRTHAQLRPGDRVLINGGSGGVGTFAIQIARVLGASRITAVCSSRNVDLVRGLGATHVVDYTKQDFVAEGGEYDVMLDNVGNRTPSECRSVLTDSGRYVVVSGPKENRWLGPIGSVIRSRASFIGKSQSFHQFTASPNQEDLTFLAELLRSGQVVPAIDRVIGLDGLAAAFDEIAGGHARAKIVVVPDSGISAVDG